MVVTNALAYYDTVSIVKGFIVQTLLYRFNPSTMWLCLSYRAMACTKKLLRAVIDNNKLECLPPHTAHTITTPASPKQFHFVKCHNAE
jgi:hypothetical protein